MPLLLFDRLLRLAAGLALLVRALRGERERAEAGLLPPLAAAGLRLLLLLPLAPAPLRPLVLGPLLLLPSVLLAQVLVNV